MESFRVESQPELDKVVRAVAGMLERRRIVAFYGEMGAGKTTLIRGIAALTGIVSGVASPTFALVNQYVTPEGERINHFDFYRINRIEEAFDMGYEEYLYGDDICLIEWPEKIEQLLPEDTLRIRIELTGCDSRLITIE